MEIRRGTWHGLWLPPWQAPERNQGCEKTLRGNNDVAGKINGKMKKQNCASGEGDDLPKVRKKSSVCGYLLLRSGRAPPPAARHLDGSPVDGQVRHQTPRWSYPPRYRKDLPIRTKPYINRPRPHRQREGTRGLIRLGSLGRERTECAHHR